MKTRFRQPAITGTLLTLRHGSYSLVVAPGFGARIVSFRYGTRDILRPTPDIIVNEPKVYEFAGFPLMPYSGPLFGPGFSFNGDSYVLDRTVREEPTATHGDAWIGAFDVRQQTENTLLLEFEHIPEPATFPFRWRGTVEYRLSDSGLSILLNVTSRDNQLMPAGLGFHPYFPKSKRTRLAFNAVGIWPADAPEVVTKGCGPLLDGLSFRDGPDVSEMVVDRLYEGWDGRAVLTYSDGHRTHITADGSLNKLQVYSAWHYPYVCVEPVSNTNDGFNRMTHGIPSHGIRILESGRSIEGTIRIWSSEPEA